MADISLGDSINNDNLGLTSVPSIANYTTDATPTANDGQDGVTNALDSIFGYAQQGANVLSTLGVVKSATPQTVSTNPNGTVQPTGANPVVNVATQAQSWITANPLLALGIGAGILGGGFLIFKLLK